MTMHDIDCTAFDNRLADYLEGDLSPADRRVVEAHVASCVRCTALVRDLEQIRAGAAELPELTPSRDLWTGIADRIETPVVPLVARPVPNVSDRRRPADRFRTAAIAAALIAVTAGVTYQLTTRFSTRPSQSVAVINPAATPSQDSNARPTLDVPKRDSVVTSQQASSAPVAPAPESLGRTVTPVTNGPESVTYSKEIDRLRTIFVRNREQLDPRTAAIIEANLKVIDDAIAQSRAALAQDPASRFLNSQLNSALGKKLELLKTAALLPSRT